MLKLCSDGCIQILCNLFNQCLEANVFPEAWKTASVRMLVKPGKNKNEACSYRPISLLSCLGKIFERYLYVYLVKELTDKKFFNEIQAGFTKGRSQQEHIFRLSQQVSNGMKERKCSVGLFLDVSAAFDSVWKCGLKYKIKRIGLPKQMENLLFSFLDSRILRVNVNGTWSEVVSLDAGTPQGACLSPILYLIYVNDASDEVNLGQLAMSQFADDIGLWASGSLVSEARIKVQNAVKSLERWCTKWQVTLNPTKSKVVIFTKCPRHKAEIERDGFTVKLFNNDIPVVPEAEFLGITFDSRLTWEPQIKKTIAKAYKRLNLMRILSATTDKQNPDTLLQIYKAIIRPIFEYGCLSMINAAEVHLDKIQLVQNQALRVVLRLPAYVSIKDLHDCSGIPLIKDHLISYARRRLRALLKSSPLLPNVITDYNRVKHIVENASVLDVLFRNGGLILGCPGQP